MKQTTYYLVDARGNLTIQTTPPTVLQRLTCRVFVDDPAGAQTYAHDRMRRAG